MTKLIRKLMKQAIADVSDDGGNYTCAQYSTRLTELIVEETLREVDERTNCHSQNSWSDHDKKWVRLHFGYGELDNARSNKRIS